MKDWNPPNADYPPPKADEPPLHWAARVGDHAEIRRLVGEGADVNAFFDLRTNERDRADPATPLMIAAGSNSGATIETIALLLELGADPAIVPPVDGGGWRGGGAACFACMGLGWNFGDGGDAARLTLLLDAGSPLPLDPEKAHRLLCDVASSGDAARVRVLLSRGLSAKGYWDPVAAREEERRSSARRTKYASSTPDPFASMPAEARASWEQTCKRLEAEMVEQYSSAPWSTDLPLFRAAESGSVECVRLLLDAGADPLARDNSKKTAMYYASSAEVIRVLMDAGVPLEDEDTYGSSPLDSALSHGDEALPRVQALIEAGANVNAAHDYGYTVFMSAVHSADGTEVLRRLLAAGSDPHAVSELGCNAFHAAVDSSCSVEAMAFLKELGVDIEHRNNREQTPLASAIESDSAQRVRAFCDRGADPNAVCGKIECGDGGYTRRATPLLFHAADGPCIHKAGKVEALLNAGADPLAKDHEGFTALERVVAALCKDTADYEPAFNAFFDELATVRFTSPATANEVHHALSIGDGSTPLNALYPGTREAYLAAATEPLRAFVQRFAARIPLDNTYGYAQEWRAEKIECIVLLALHASWARLERSRRTAP